MTKQKTRECGNCIRFFKKNILVKEIQGVTLGFCGLHSNFSKETDGKSPREIYVMDYDCCKGYDGGK